MTYSFCVLVFLSSIGLYLPKVYFVPYHSLITLTWRLMLRLESSSSARLFMLPKPAVICIGGTLDVSLDKAEYYACGMESFFWERMDCLL